MRKSIILVAVSIIAGAGIAAGATEAVQAGASNPAVTYYGCVSSKGALSKVGTSAPTCSAKSTQISWNSVGPQGPAGTARDVGSVVSTPQGGVFETEGLVGWVAVTNPSTGNYCLTPDPSSTLGNSALQVSPGSPGGAGVGLASWAGYCSLTPLEFQVQTTTVSGVLTNGVPFTAAIP